MVILSIVINQSWELCQLDVKNAFLYGDLTDSVLMEQLLGYVAQGEDRVCRLKKIIYGLRQSPRVLFEKFSQWSWQVVFRDVLLIILFSTVGLPMGVRF